MVAVIGESSPKPASASTISGLSRLPQIGIDAALQRHVSELELASVPAEHHPRRRGARGLVPPEITARVVARNWDSVDVLTPTEDHHSHVACFFVDIHANSDPSDAIHAPPDLPLHNGLVGLWPHAPHEE
jgi:hypothetical protein